MVAAVCSDSGKYWLLLAIPLCLLLAACAQTPENLRFDPFAGEQSGNWPTWPRAPEVPRYIYAGLLTGERNFKADEVADRQAIGQAFAWLVGLGQEVKKPVVLQRPQSGTVDAAGRIYVTDVSRRGVFVFDAVAGQLNVWERATSSERFISPIAIVVDRQGDLLVSDADLGIIARLKPDGTPDTPFGRGLLKRPTGIARDAQSGRLFVADTRANDIKVFDGNGELIDTLGSAGDMPGRLNAPTYLAFADGLLYVTDTLNSRIQVFDAEGNAVRQFGERGIYIGNLARPKGISVDSEGNVYVVESYFDHLLIFDREGRFLLPIGGTGGGPGEFYLPAGVWTDSRDQVYVADMFNGRVEIFQFLGGTQ